jgi:hypothetical protein
MEAHSVRPGEGGDNRVQPETRAERLTDSARAGEKPRGVVAMVPIHAKSWDGSQGRVAQCQRACLWHPHWASPAMRWFAQGVSEVMKADLPRHAHSQLGAPPMAAQQWFCVHLG